MGRPLAIFAVLCAFVLLPAHAAAYTFGSTVQQLGPEQTVFDWDTMRCEDHFAADSPARAWKDSTGKVHLTISSDNSYAMVGSSLNTVAVDCSHVLLPSEHNADPSAYDDTNGFTLLSRSTAPRCTRSSTTNTTAGSTPACAAHRESRIAQRL